MVTRSGAAVRAKDPAGIANLLEHPEYKSLEKAQPLMSLLSEADLGPLPATVSGAEGD